MTKQEVDSDNFEGSITSGGSETLEVKTGRASTVVVYVDDGTTGGAPASYSLTLDAHHDEFDDYQRQESVAAGTAFYNEMTANGSKMKVTLSDESAGTATRRVLVKSYRSLD